MRKTITVIQAICLLVILAATFFLMGARGRYGPFIWQMVSGGIQYIGGNVNITNGTLTVSGALSVDSINGEQITDNTIDEDSLDFGTGTDQISATDLPDFGTMTATGGNVLVGDGSDFESKAIVSHENEIMFYENEIVTY